MEKIIMKLRAVGSSDALHYIKQAIQMLDLIKHHDQFGKEYGLIIDDTSYNLSEALDILSEVMEELRKYDYE